MSGARKFRRAHARLAKTLDRIDTETDLRAARGELAGLVAAGNATLDGVMDRIGAGAELSHEEQYFALAWADAQARLDKHGAECAICGTAIARGEHAKLSMQRVTDGEHLVYSVRWYCARCFAGGPGGAA